MEDSDLEEYTDIQSLKMNIEKESVNLIQPDIFKIYNTANINLPPSYSVEFKLQDHYFETFTDQTLFYIFYETTDAINNKIYNEDKELETKLIQRKNLATEYLNKLGYKFHTKLNSFVFLLGDILPDERTKDLLVFDRVQWMKVNIHIKIDSEFIRGFK